MMGVINPAPFNHQYKTMWITRQRLDRGTCHLGQARLAVGVSVAIVFKVHMAGLK